MRAQPKVVDRMRSLLVAAATAAVIALNFMAATGRLFDVDTGEISNRYPTVITPAGYAFSIWSLIYLGLTAFSIYQMFASQLERFRGIRTLYLVSCVLNCAWLLAWHQFQIGIASIILFLLVGVLAVINAKVADNDKGAELVLIKGTFGIYFGWVSVAAFANLFIYLRYAGVELSAPAWNMLAIAVIAVVLLAATAVRVAFRNFLYPLAVAWALTAIAIKQSGNTSVILAAAIAVILCLVLSLSFVMDLRNSRQ